MADLPIVITAAGLQPRSLQQVQLDLLTRVSAVRPDYTANLPGILIEDISSTDCYAILECDSAQVETVNSLTPLGANAFLLLQLGQMLGVMQGEASNTSVFLVFTGTPGFVIGRGFQVSDGNYTYQLTDGGIVGDDGLTPQLYAVATQSGTWAVPAGTVTQLLTSVPSSVSLSVINTEAGIPGAEQESEASYRAQVLTANYAASQGMARYLRTLLRRVDGVQARLISARKLSTGWTIIVGGGDPKQVAYAIYTALFDVYNLTGSVLSVVDITDDLPALVETDLNHGFPVGYVINIAGVDPSSPYDGDYVVMSVPSEKTFTLGKPYDQQGITAASWTTGVAEWTTVGAHGVTVGSTFQIVGVDPVGYNGTFVATGGTTGSTLEAAMVSDPGSYVADGDMLPGNALYDTSGGPAYVSGGVVTPNLRNIEESIIDYPDTYVIPYVNPPQQAVTGTITWATSSPNFVSSTAIAQLAGPAIVDYINSINVGEPINVLALEDAFQVAVSAILPTSQISVLDFSMAINGIGTPPVSGTKTIVGDPESYFFTAVTDLSFVQV
jgi:hypothetical protein